ncbi:hypothetical protein SAMN04487820_105215 [Actinopolyspora mzabensis]|uniref:Transposase n=1 Tax=Actinopolyspora mzabensis TaxID=995066 RepID=A0A1G8ZYU6_ACTMZ|nr:hypothetical protein SAMN04487820_105215 [Actinopolyspora mzabensis]
MAEPDEIGAFVGLDVGKDEHHVRSITPNGKKVLDKWLPNSEPTPDVQRHTSELGQGWVTTVEQTVLDLVTLPELGGLPEQARAAAHDLLDRCDRRLLDELAVGQRRQASLARLLEAA